MERILQNTAATITATFSIDGEVADPGSATVTVLRSDGSVLVAETAATDEGDGEFSYVLTAAQTAALDMLQARWTATIDSQLSTITTRYEIVGGFYFTISEFRARYAAAAEKSASDIAEARATAEDTIEGLDAEEGTHVAFVPRFARFPLSGGQRMLSIPRHHATEILWMTENGTPVSTRGLILQNSSIFGRWWPPRSVIEVAVSHGFDSPPARIKNAAMLLAYHTLVKGPIDDRATGITTESGTITLATPGQRGSVTGIPEVDAAIKQFARPKPVPASVSVIDPAIRHRRSGIRDLFSDLECW